MFEQALAQCGATPGVLSSAERSALDRRGYIVMPAVAREPWLSRMHRAFEQGAGRHPTGTRHLDLLAGADESFDPIFTHPQVLAAVHHVLRRPFQVLLAGGRDPRPGYGQQGLHADWVHRSPADAFAVATAIWTLDEFTPTNGPTRLIPGSHEASRPLPRSMRDPAGRHPDQVLITAPPGSVLLMNGHLWHSGTRNDSDGSRRAVQCQFVACDRVPPGTGPRDVPERLSAAARCILTGGSGRPPGERMK